ncbi:MAG TPA: hypothetical protein PLE87_01720 [Phycisphaerae bacterium]|nr:hypothetical protein [Phycisphaerae bacterium]
METNVPIPEISAASGPPDWASVTDEIRCPLCEYNLRGLIEPRCPECGYPFSWSEVLDAARHHHPYLFEHHGRTPFRSFWRTVWGGRRPRVFWTDLYPAQKIHPRLLLLYWLITLVPGFVAVFLISLFITQFRVLVALEQMFDDDFAFVWITLSWPWLVFLSLLIFRWSMHRAKVSTGHVLRCIVYSHDAFFWAGLFSSVLLAGLLIQIALVPGFNMAAVPNMLPPVMVGSVLGLVLAHLVAIWRLYRAYQLYMRFDHVWATLASAIIIALLTLANVLVLFA